MPVNNTTSLAGPFIPNGTTTIFPFAFNAQQVSDVAVYDGDGATVSSALYTVALYEGDGGTVTFETAPTSAQFAQLYIALVPSFAQTADFTNAGPTYNPAQLTAALDAISTRLIALKAEVDRALKVRRGDGVALMPADRSGKFLAFDAGGNPVVATGTGADSALRSDLAASGGAALAGFQQSGTGVAALTIEDKARQLVSAADFTTIANADADTRRKFVPGGVYASSLASTALTGPYWGLGQIRDAANNKRAPWFSAVKAAPSSLGNHDSVETAFNGDFGRNQIAMEHRVTGAATLGQPTTGYLYRPETMPFYGYLYNESGWNNSTSGNGGRTGAAFMRVQVYQAGQGDAVCYNASAFVTGTKAGSTDFLANPAAVLFNGDIAAGAAGVYLNPGEFALRDNGNDAAGIGWVVNLYRDNDTGAKGAFWAGFQAQSQGTKSANHAFGAFGKFKVGLEATTADLGSENALISGKAGQRIYLNNASSNGRYTTSFNGDYVEYSTAVGGVNVVVGGTSRFQITNDRVTFLQPLRLPTVTVAALPAATTRAGMEYYVSDANATTRLATVVGGGANFVKVFSNGTNWVIA